MAISNPITVSWKNPVTFVDGSPYEQADNAGYQISFDAQPVVAVPLQWGASFDLTTLAAYKALKKGAHTLALQAVSIAEKGGIASAPASAPFQVDVAPSPVTDLVLA